MGVPDLRGALRFIACNENREVIKNILTHLDAKTLRPEASMLRPSVRALPQQG